MKIDICMAKFHNFYQTMDIPQYIDVIIEFWECIMTSWIGTVENAMGRQSLFFLFINQN